MATAHSPIEWTDSTWNPVTGCTKVSPGCDHCYAERITTRFQGPGAFGTVTTHPDRLSQPARWRTGRRVFVNSMSDLFHPAVGLDLLAGVFAVMAGTPRHTYQILTKRPARARALLGGPGLEHAARDKHHASTGPAGDWRWPLPNVWLGVSVETQQWAETRVPALLATPAALRFVSAEPLLGPVDLTPWLASPHHHAEGHHDPDTRWVGAPIGPEPLRLLDWVITGGESGPRARPADPGWVRALRDACVTTGVPFFFKQWGGRTPKTGGRTLDGHTWQQYPTPPAGQGDGPQATA
ncbi:MAG TPA: phage Gp37/Gp68 family protein [Mycobacteriales bacterium]|nr:phage Gp37/Gp68 family protein [Mycobacteriales bacterium]